MFQYWIIHDVYGFRLIYAYINAFITETAGTLELFVDFVWWGSYRIRHKLDQIFKIEHKYIRLMKIGIFEELIMTVLPLCRYTQKEHE